LGDILNELLQNARRAGATQVNIEPLIVGGKLHLKVADDGQGFFADGGWIALGGSGWTDSIQAEEDPAGCGIFSLANRGCTIEANGKKSVLTRKRFVGKEDVPIEAGNVVRGTEITFPISEGELSKASYTVRKCAEYYPLPVNYSGESVKRVDYLQGVLYQRDWHGVRIGVIERYRERGLNFHGLVVLAELPTIQHEAFGSSASALTVRLDVRRCPELELVLPARKEVVHNEFYAELLVECERTLFDYIATLPAHSLAFTNWQRARELGIELPEAQRCLKEEVGGQITQIKQVSDDGIIFDGNLENDEYITFSRAYLNSENPRLFLPCKDFEGYSWYDAQPRIKEVAFSVESEQGEESLLLATDSWGEFRPLALKVFCTLASSETLLLTTDVALVSGYGGCCFPDEGIVLVTRDSEIEPSELADLIEQAWFCPSDDWQADSEETQLARFQEEAFERAVSILLSDEDALLARIQMTVKRELAWLLPRDKVTRISFDESGGLKVTF
jgi:hypothetical protein